MSDGFTLQLNGLMVAPFPNVPQSGWPGGFRINPGVIFRRGVFFAELNVETGFYNEIETPLKLDYFEQHGSHALTPRSPLLLYKSYLDKFRFHLGIRSLSVGAIFNNGIQLRFGPHYYEQTQFDNFFTNYGYSPGAEFAKTWTPVGFVGGEVRYQYQPESQENSGIRNFLVGSSVMWGGDKTIMGLGQVGIEVALGKGTSAPIFGLTGYFVYRTNSTESGPHEGKEPAEIIPGPKISDPGRTLGVGGGAYFNYGIFSGGVAYTDQRSSATTVDSTDLHANRSAVIFLADLHPEKWRFRSALFLLNRFDGEYIAEQVSKNRSEIDFELTIGYRPANGVEFNIGYRAAFGEGYAVHLGLAGIQLYWQKFIPRKK